MEKMPGLNRFYHRGAVYYFRAAIPTGLKKTYPRTEEKLSLKTKEFEEAKKRCRIESVKVDKKFEAHRRKLQGEKQQELNAEQIRWLADSVLRWTQRVTESHLSVRSIMARLSDLLNDRSFVLKNRSQPLAGRSANCPFIGTHLTVQKTKMSTTTRFTPGMLSRHSIVL